MVIYSRILGRKQLRFIGIDLAWKVSDNPKQRTGLAAINDSGLLLDVGLAATDNEILSFIRKHAEDSCAVGIDAPLIVINKSGRRPAEHLLARRRISAYPANRTWLTRVFGGIRGEALAEKLQTEGFNIAIDYHENSQRLIFEVYPTPAYRTILGLGSTVKIKRGKGVRVADIRKGLGIARHALLNKTLSPPLIIDDSILPRPVAHLELEALCGPQLDQFGDMLDAIVSAYIVYLYRLKPESIEVVGDLDTGFILLGRDIHK